MRKKEYKLLFTIILVALSVSLPSKATFGAAITWDGGGSSCSWSEATNWSTDEVPGSIDDVIFNGTNVDNACLDLNTTVNSITMTTAFTGEFYMAPHGLNMQAWSEMNFTGTTATAVDPTINHPNAWGEPLPGIGADTYSVRWTGYIKPLYTETYTFHETTDDGCRLWVNDQLLHDDWTDGGMAQKNSSTIALVAGRLYSIKMEMYENGGGDGAILEWSSASQAEQVIPESAFYAAHGLSATYFAGTDLTGDFVRQVDPRIDFDWGTSAPNALVGQNFSARWEGFIKPLYTQTYTFYSDHDDGTRIWVDGTLVIDQWSTCCAEHSGTIALTAGKMYHIKVELEETGGQGDIDLSWSSTSQAKEIVPVSALYTGFGVNATYYNNGESMDGTSVTHNVFTLNWTFGSGSPDPIITPADELSGRFTGMLMPAFTETYTFYVDHDDGARLSINNISIFDNFGGGSSTGSGTIALTAGTAVPFEIEWEEDGGNADIDLEWESTSQVLEHIEPYILSNTTLSIKGTGDFRKGGNQINAENGAIEFIGTTPQTFTPYSGATMPVILQNGSGGTKVANNDLITTDLRVTSGVFDISTNARTLTITSGKLYIEGGTLTATNGTLDLNGSNSDVDITAGTLTAPGAGGSFTVGDDWEKTGGTFNHSNGTVFFDVAAGGTKNLFVNGSAFYNLTVSVTDDFDLEEPTTVANTLTLTGGKIDMRNVGDTHSAGNFTASAGTLDFGTGGSTLQITSGNADLSGLATLDIGTNGTLEFTATSGTQTYTPKTGVTHPNLKKSGSGGTVLVANVAHTAGSFEITDGTWDWGDNGNTHVVSTITASGGAIDFGTGILQVGSGDVDLSALTAITAGTGTLEFTGSTPLFFTPTAGGTHPIIRQSGSSTISIITNTLITGLLDIVSGTLSVGNGGTTGGVDNTSNITNNSALEFNRSNASSYGGVISGNGTVTKLATGTLTLSGVNTYTGTTNINTGTLSLTGSLAAGSAVTVGASATLEGTGTVNGSLSNAGTLAPGVGAGNTGTLSTAGVTFTGGSYAVDLNGTTPAYDQISSSGTVALGTGITSLTIASISNSDINDVYIIINAASVIGTFIGLAEADTMQVGGRSLRINYTATQVTLTDVAIITDFETEAPTLTLPATSSSSNSSIAVDFDLAEPALSSSVKLTFTQTGGITDAGSPHILRVVSESSGSHTFTLDGTDLAGGTAEIEAVESGTSALVNGSIYSVKIEYQDIIPNPAASVTNTGFTYDIGAVAPVLTSPAASSSDNSSIAMDFNLGEVAAEGTVKITFTNTGGSPDPTPHVLVVASEASGSHTFTLDGTSLAGGTPEIEAVESGGLSLVEDAIYDVKLEYQDLVGNSASVTNASFTYNSTAPAPTLTSPGVGSRSSTQIPVDYNLPQVAAASTVKITFTRVAGSADPTPHVLRVVSEAAGDHTFTIDGSDLAGGTAEIEAVESGGTSLVNGALYNVRLEYQDGVGNTGTVTNNSFTYDNAAVAPTLTNPAASSTDDITLGISYALQEDALAGTVQMTFTLTAGTDADAPHVLTFNNTDSFELSGGTRSTTLNALDLSADSHVASVSSGANDNLKSGATYDVMIDFQDLVGNSASTTNAGFTYDNSGAVPNITVNSLSTNQASPELTGTVSQDAAVVTITIGAENFVAPVAAGVWTIVAGTFQNLSEGTFEVVAVADFEGVQGTDNSSNELEIDLTTPMAATTDYNVTTVTPDMSGTVDDPTATVSATVNGQVVNAVVAGTDWTIAGSSFTGLGTGSYTIILTATDPVGNVGIDSTSTLSIDMTPVLGVDADDVIPAANVIQQTDGSGNITLEFRAKDPAQANVLLDSIEYNTGSGWVAIPPASPALPTGWNTTNRSAQADFGGALHNLIIGTSHIVQLADVFTAALQFRVRAKNGESGDWAVSGAVPLDNEFPDVTIVSQTTPERSPLISGTSSEELSLVQVTVNGTDYLGVITGPAAFEVPAGIVATLDNGTYSISVSATDLLGNNSNKNFADVLTVNGDAAGITVVPLNTTQTRPALTGTVSEDNAVVTITIGTNNYTADVNNGVWTIDANVIAELAEGTYDITATAEFGGVQGVDGTAGELVIDRTAPVVSTQDIFTSQLDSEITGTVSEPLTAVLVTIDGQTVSATVTDTNWSVDGTLFSEIGEGSYPIELAATDPAGNIGTDNTSTLLIDTSPPLLVTLTPLDIKTTLKPELRMEFNESVVAGGGSIHIVAGESVQEVIPVDSAQGLNSNTLTFSLTDSLVQKTEYHVLVDTNALTDVVGNAYTGISDTALWIFTTSSEDDTFVGRVTTTSEDGIYALGQVIDIRITFTDTVILSGGNLNITLETGLLDTIISIEPFETADEINFTYTVKFGDFTPALDINSLSLEGDAILQDLAGNDIILDIGQDQKLTATSTIALDGIPLEFEVVKPGDGGEVDNALLTYTLSKDLAVGSVTWKQVDDSIDPDSLLDITLPFTNEMLASGNHTEVDLEPGIIRGATYDITITVTDSAGNTATIAREGVKIGEKVTAIHIFPGELVVQLNDEVAFEAQDVITDDAVTEGVEWTLIGVGTLDSAGNYTATGLGDVTIIAGIPGFSDTLTFTVKDGSISIPGDSEDTLSVAGNLMLQMAIPLSENTIIGFSFIEDTLLTMFDLVGPNIKFDAFKVDSMAVMLKLDSSLIDTSQTRGFAVYQMMDDEGLVWKWVSSQIEGEWISFTVADAELGAYILASNNETPEVKTYDPPDAGLGEDLCVPFESSSNIVNPELSLIYFEGGGDPVTLVLAHTEGDSACHNIPGSAVGLNGLAWRFEIKDGTSNVLTGYQEVSVINTEDISIPDTLKENVYQSFSLPMVHREKSVDSLLMGEWGEADPKYWRLYEYDTRFKELNKDSDLETGEAYWFKMKDQTPEIIIKAGSAWSVPLATGITLSLHEGWNTFSNPYLFNITVAQLRSVNGDEPLYVYAFPQADDYTELEPGDEIKPWKGYIVWNGASGSEILPELNISGIFHDFVRAKRGAPDMGRQIKLSLKGSKSYNGEMTISYNTPGAREGRDSRDLPKPSSLSSSVAIDLKVPWSKQAYMTDRRGKLGEGKSWKFTTRSSKSNEVLTLSLKGNHLTAPHHRAVLLYDTKGEVVELTRTPEFEYSYTSDNSRSDEFELVLGTDEYVKQKIEAFNSIIRVFSLGQNFPNPFTSATRIVYHLPHNVIKTPVRVTLNVYNLKGELVHEMVNEKQGGGSYRYVWFGTKRNGDRLPAGTYFYRLRAGNEFSAHRKLVLLR